MKLSDLLRAADIDFFGEEKEISFITDDSRKCGKGTLFVCHEKGESYLNEAIKNGAQAVVAFKKLFDQCFVASDTRKSYSMLCREFFSRPDEKLKMIAVTGTNGKTSVSFALHYMLSLSGHKTGIIGTVCNSFEDCKTSNLTTPDCFELYSMLSHMVKYNFEYCVMEASSQGIAQERLYSIAFEAGIFTNLTEDHLDYHKTFENYKNAKIELFRHCRKAIINYDDKYKDEFIGACKGKIITYSIKSDKADFTARNIRFSPDSTTYELVSDFDIRRIRLQTRGDFWVVNSLAAIVCARENGLSVEQCAYSIGKFSGVKGRMELVETDTDFSVIIDYAHTPDGLQKALLSLKRFSSGRLILVFGCGGDREKEKRSVMGTIAVTYADIVFITSDNPRTENPQEIIDDILTGVKKGKKSVYIRQDRKKAIEDALKTAKKGDIVLLAGKGHEVYQLVGTQKLPFDERQIVGEILNGVADRSN